MHRWLVTCLVVAVGCGGARGPEGSGGPQSASAEEAVAASAALRAAEDLYEGQAFREAALKADSLFLAWGGVRSLSAVANRALWLKGRSLEAAGDLADARSTLETLLERLGDGAVRRETVRRLASILHLTGEDVAVLELVLAYPESVGDVELELVRSAAILVAPAELERLAARNPAQGPVTAVVHAELARGLALTGRLRAAKEAARQVLAVVPSGSAEAELAEAVVAAGEQGPGRVRVGLVLPLSGRFAPVGNLLLEGIELALEEWGGTSSNLPAVELLVQDNGSSPERSVELVAELEAAGALAIIGPVRSESFAASALARRNPRLLLVSPTATDILDPAPGAYTLWSRERRQRDVARDVATWVVENLGLRRAAILYPNTTGGKWAAQGFRMGMEDGQGEIVESQAYSPEATTFAEPIQAIAAARPDAVFVASESAPAVLQIAPQLFFFGVDRSVVLGGASWAEPAVVRRLDPFAANYRIVGTFVDRTGEGTPFARFRDAYENKYGKTMRDNVLPALGYDAMKLVLAGIERTRLPFPGAISGAVADLEEIVGATGRLAPDPTTSTVVRRTLIRMLRDGRLHPPAPSTVLTWLEEARVRADSIAEARADSIATARADSTAGVRRPQPRNR